MTHNPIQAHRIKRRRLVAQLAVAIRLAPGKKQWHRNSVPSCGRRTQSRGRQAFFNDPDLLRITEPPAPACVHNLEPLNATFVSKDIHTDSLLPDRPLRPRRPSTEAYHIAAFGIGQKLRIDNGAADSLSDLTHGFADRVEKGATGVFHEMPAVGHLIDVR